jgi:hypothetical protein
MTRPAEIALENLRTATERIRANLVDLELDPSQEMLQASKLEGESARQWAVAGAAMSELWQWLSLLEETVTKGDKLRASRSWDALEGVFSNNSLELSTADVPLVQRDLLGRQTVTIRCSPADLIGRMVQSFDEVKAVVAKFGAAWDQWLPRMKAAGEELVGCEQLAQAAGESERADLAGLKRELVALNSALSRDPLTVDRVAVDALPAQIASVRKDLEQTAELRRGFDARLAAASAALQALRDLGGELEAAHAQVEQKIAGAQVPGPLAIGGDVEPGLDAVRQIASAGSWREARSALEQWEARVARLTGQARTAIAANRAPIEERNEMRALLDAYQVKARRLGLVEDPHVAEKYARAHDALFTWPTDLATARQLVRAYQDELSGAAPPRKAAP